jgi:hypothetical protein
MIRSVCVFCGSSNGASPAYVDSARAFGQEAVRRGIRIVYGGAGVGVMGALADAVLDAGGEVTGVMPRSLVEREVVHTGLTDLRVVDTMHDRKALMAELSDAFVALPGGLGTLEELFEVWTWGMLGLHAKPYGLLNVDGYYTPLIQFLDHAVTQGFVRPAQRAELRVHEDPRTLLTMIGALSATD